MKQVLTPSAIAMSLDLINSLTYLHCLAKRIMEEFVLFCNALNGFKRYLYKVEHFVAFLVYVLIVQHLISVST